MEKNLIENFLSDAQIDLTHKKVLIAVSGGADSMACAHYFISQREKFKLSEIALIHMNHGLRGDESNADTQLVASFAYSNEIKCYQKTINGLSYSGASLENWLREQRYSFFEHVIQENNYDFCMTAHNLNDLAESFIMRIERGVGFEGLECIRLLRDKTYLRPLLGTSRKTIETYIQSNTIPFREDQSNSDLAFKRNVIRHSALPGIIKHNPNFLEKVFRISQYARETRSFVSTMVAQTFSDTTLLITSTTFESNIPRLRELLQDPLNKDLFFMHLNGIWKQLTIPQFSTTLFEIIFAYILNTDENNAPLTLQLKQGWRLSANQKTVRVSKNHPTEDYIIPFPLGSSVTFNTNEKTYTISSRTLSPDEKPDFKGASDGLIYLDRDKLPLDLVIRNKNARDVFSPLGTCAKSRKLTKFLSDRKLLKEQQLSTPLLATINDIIWVINYQISDNYKIDDATKQIIEMSVTCKTTI